MRLENKVAIVTGAASGFGEGIAHRFAQEGCAVIAADINDEACEAVASAINDVGGRAMAVHCDVTARADVAGAVQRAQSEFGPLTTMVNNAGMPQRNQSMLEVDEDTFDRIFAVNVKSIYIAALEAVPHLRENGGGTIINTASTAALSPRPGLTWYNGSKGAAVTLTKSMAVELAPDNVRVNALCPVAGETPMLAEFLGGQVTNEMRDKFVSTVPIGRLSTATDIANAALFLASDEAEFITGVCLEVDGGRCI
ncbi:MAG: glucose 1-dehydrogenase [Alphaproteobacteria bacterium]|nr:glucose 1-dehydrogenase [Alphaproteobacteria bacterium]